MGWSWLDRPNYTKNKNFRTFDPYSQERRHTMENFIVSARKYRPQTFDTVVGQKSITNTLKNAIKNKQLAQAFLFCGPRGVGKTTCARILAKTINCENPSPAIEACDQCTSCRSFNENASFNIYELDGASNNSVDDIRTLVDQVRIPPQMGNYKVYIIDEVHMLSASAFNAFLKTLEEPPAYAKFILATTEKHRILPTILSRCQIFDFRRITVDDIAGHLQYVAEREHITIEDNARHVIAQKADGAMRDALSIFDQLVSFAGNSLTYEMVLENLNVLDHEYFFRITDQILQGDTASTLLTINDIIDKGFEGQHFLIGFGEHLRSLLVSKDPATLKLLETAPSIRQQYHEQSARCTVPFLLKLLDLNNRCDLSYKASNNKRLHLEISLMQMCSLVIQPEPIAAVQPPVTGSPSRVMPPVSAPTPSPPNPVNPLPVQPVAQPARDGTASPEKKGPEPVRMKDLNQKINAAAGTPPSTLNQNVNEAGSENGNGDTDSSPAAIFSQSQLFEAWDEFADSLKTSQPHLYSTLKSSRPQLKEDWSIVFELGNKVMEDELKSKSSELMEFLRTKLMNGSIRLQTTVTETSVQRKPYTDREKYERMAEKNPNLHTLRERLDLEIEY
jgi:DNA polymerase-3 subunit gamma/tau